MESTLTNETLGVEQPTPDKCINCGSEDILQGHPNALCADCREKFIKFPFPLWIKAFGIGVGVVVVFSLSSFFGNLQTGIHMERGVRAEHEHLYLTAQREFEQVLKKVPNHVEAKAHLLIAAFYNQDIQTMIEASNSLEGKTFENQELYQQVDDIIKKGTQFFPSDSLNAIYDKYKGAPETVRAAVIDGYYRNNPIDVSAGLKIASDAIEKDVERADTVLQKILSVDPENISAITFMATVKRYQKDASGALPYLDKLLSLNKENLYALSSKARAMLMLKKDEEALKLANKVEKLDKTFGYNMATLAIIYHYTNKIKERDKIINNAKASKDSSVMEYMQYALDIINSKEKLRS